jgi:anti-sigma regulatory factor (Ser/Thr protein kinase)
MESRTFLATLEHLHEMLRWIKQKAEKAGLHEARLYQIELACEEVIVNIIHHSYQDRGGKIEIQLQVLPKKEISITLLDDGAPFNPLTQEVKPQEIGGLGLLFIRECTDEALYERADNRNKLTLVKKL